jgi:hypothetical protein
VLLGTADGKGLGKSQVHSREVPEIIIIKIPNNNDDLFIYNTNIVLSLLLFDCFFILRSNHASVICFFILSRAQMFITQSDCDASVLIITV